MKRLVDVTQTVEVEVDESKFTPEFMQEFRNSFYSFHTINQHLEHLAQLYARGLDRDFIEGYGPAQDFGIRFSLIDSDSCARTEMESL